MASPTVPRHRADLDRLCERYPVGQSSRSNSLTAGGYDAAFDVDELPAEIETEANRVFRGYAAGVGAWYFFRALEPAITFGRAARMSLDCRGYGVYSAAWVASYCLKHQRDERVLLTSGSSLDRRSGEVLLLERFVQGVKEKPSSSYWHEPHAMPPIAALADPTRASARAKPCAVYLQYDAAGALLYVGVSENPIGRGKTHAGGSTWTDFATRGEHEWHPDRATAESREAELIRTRRPLFNVQHNDADAPQRLAAYLAAKGRFDLLIPTITRA